MIRLATPADGQALAAIYAPAVTDHTTSFELEPPDGAEMARRVEKLMARTPWLVCEWESKVVGYAYAGSHRDRWAYQWSVEVSAYVDASAHRSGVGRALYASLFAVLAVQGFRNAYAGITLPNAASERLHEAVGFTPVGIYRGIGYKFGAWHDVLWLERALAPRMTDPPAPTLLPDAAVLPAFRTAIETGLPLLRLDKSRLQTYLASLPPDSRRIIDKMREAILASAPGAIEEISYGFPVFKLDGKPVVWCAAWKNHTSIYPITPAVTRALATEIKAYDVAKGTIRFPLTKPPSAAFVKRLVRARIAELKKKPKAGKAR